MRAPFIQLYVHFVWSTWDRAPLITADIQDRLYAALAKRCNEWKCDTLAVGGIEDHIHLLVCLHPTVCVADLVQYVKGGTSHLMNKEIRPGGKFRWQGAYGAFTVHESYVEGLKEYIFNQKGHHADNALLSDFERTDIIA